jgi:hypothetical protein
MALTAQQIAEIAAIVSGNGYWGDGINILNNLGLPKDARANGTVNRRTLGYLQQADDDASNAILRYFEVGPHRHADAPWPRRGLKLFISHRDDQKATLALLREALEYYGIASFLAHEAIEIGKVWRAELETGLRSMEALFAYCSAGFAASDWTGQEVGYAFGKNVPILAVMAGENLKGLLEQVQVAKAIVQDDATARKLAELIFDQLKRDARAKASLSEGLARELKFAGSFGHARFLAEQLVEIGELTDRAQSDIISALEVNIQTEDVKLNDEFMELVFG